jgi:2'-hydroxyisoflavone reductase
VPPAGTGGGISAVSIKRALDKGLTFRPLAETVRDTLAWFRQQPKERQEKLRAGITKEREAEVLKDWANRGKTETSPAVSPSPGPKELKS